MPPIGGIASSGSGAGLASPFASTVSDGRQAHANARNVAAQHATAHLQGAEPEIMPADVLASKLP